MGHRERRVRGDAERALEARAARGVQLLCCCHVFVVGQVRCHISGRAARRVWVERQDAQGLGRGDRRMRGDAGRALERRALRRPLYSCDDLASS